MSQWTEWQLQKFQILFEKYAKKKKNNTNNEYRLFIKEKSLVEITKKLGPEVSESQIKELIYQYDSNCQGYFDFEDFCTFIGDYLLTLNEARQKAIHYYKKMVKKRKYLEKKAEEVENENENDDNDDNENKNKNESSNENKNENENKNKNENESSNENKNENENQNENENESSNENKNENKNENENECSNENENENKNEKEDEKEDEKENKKDDEKDDEKEIKKEENVYNNIKITENETENENEYETETEIETENENNLQEEINLFFERFPKVDDYLNKLCLYNHDDILVDDVENDEDLMVNDSNILKRTIQVRIYSAINIDQFFRIKYRENLGIEYNSLDPFVRVTLAGESKETTVLIGSTKPLWNQDLIFSIIVPPGEIQDIQTWVESQSFYFELFDYNSHGIVSHTELLASGSIPLSQVLYNTKKTVMIDLLMNNSMDLFETSKPVYLEILIEDLTAEKWSWAKVRDKYTYPEEVWINKYLPKLKHDLENEVFDRKQGSVKKEENLNEELKVDDSEISLTDTVFGYYQSICSTLYTVFKNRMFPVIALNENNNFVLLPCLLTPISYKYKTKEQIARFVSLIPSSTDMLPISDESRKILSSFSALNISKLYYYIPTESSSIQFYSTSITPYNTDSFYRQFNSPNTVLFKKRGSLLEHCMILCDLFLGIGCNAYVAVGKLKFRPYMWVIVMENVDKNPLAESKLKLFIKNHKTFNVTKFSNYNNLLEEYKYKCKIKITHWNVMTGQSFVDGQENRFQCENIEALFNHKNIYFNIQRSENFSRSVFSWNIEDNTKWMPFLSTENTFGEIKCSYENRILSSRTFSSKSNIEEEYTFLSSLMKLIILYRRHFLFIMDTEFFRPLCKHFQEKLENIEKVIQNNDKESIREFANNIFSNINSYLPIRHYFQGGLYCFKDNNPNLVLEELISIGHINNSIPNSLLVISSKTFHYADGIKCVWIIIGYIYDINIYEML